MFARERKSPYIQNFLDYVVHSLPSVYTDSLLETEIYLFKQRSLNYSAQEALHVKGTGESYDQSQDIYLSPVEAPNFTASSNSFPALQLKQIEIIINYVT